MTDGFFQDVHEAERLRDRIRTDPAAIRVLSADLIALVESDSWLAAQIAVDALARAVEEYPEELLSSFESLVLSLLDADVPASGQLGSVVREVAVVTPTESSEILTHCLDATYVAETDVDPRGVEHSLTALLELVISESARLDVRLNLLRDIFEHLPTDAKRTVLQIHFALVDIVPEAVEPVVPLVLEQFDSGGREERRVATDLLCALARKPDYGPGLVATLLRWLASRPATPRRLRATSASRESYTRPNLTDNIGPSIIGGSMALARIAEESPKAVLPHVEDIATTLAAHDSSDRDGLVRGHLSRAVAAVAYHDAAACRSKAISRSLRDMLEDDAWQVRYWAAQGLLAIGAGRNTNLSSAALLNRFHDTNPDVRNLCLNLLIGAIETDSVNVSPVVDRLHAALSNDESVIQRRAIEWLSAIANVRPAAVTPVVPDVLSLLTEDTMALEAATLLETMADAEPEVIGSHASALLDALTADSIARRSAITDILAPIAANAPESLDRELARLVRQLHQCPLTRGDASKVLAPLTAHPSETSTAVFEHLFALLDTAEPDQQQRVIRTLGELLAQGSAPTDRLLDTLKAHLTDENEHVRDAAIEALGEYLAATPERGLSLLQEVERAVEDGVCVGASILARSVQTDPMWPTADVRGWMAETLMAADDETRKSLLNGMGVMLASGEQDETLWSALLTALTVPDVQERALREVRRVVRQQSVQSETSKFSTAIISVLRDSNSSVPPACFDIIAAVPDACTSPQQLSDLLCERVSRRDENLMDVTRALASLCRCHEQQLSVYVPAFLNRVPERIQTATNADCERFGRAVGAIARVGSAGDELCETLATAMASEDVEDEVAALRLVAGVAQAWPTGVRPLADTLQSKLRGADDSVQGSALTALVYIGREDPGVLAAITEQLTGILAAGLSAEPVQLTRRRYEGLSLLLADRNLHASSIFESVRQGAEHNDSIVVKYCFEALEALNDPRFSYLLERKEGDTAGWTAIHEEPSHHITRS